MWGLFISKRNEEQKGIWQIWHLEIFYIKECFQIVKRNTTWCLKSSFGFQNDTSCGIIKFTVK